MYERTIEILVGFLLPSEYSKTSYKYFHLLQFTKFLTSKFKNDDFIVYSLVNSLSYHSAQIIIIYNINIKNYNNKFYLRERLINFRSLISKLI